MAITTDSYIEVRDTSSVLQDKIGLSKTLDNYTLEEITSYCYCGADNNLIKYPVKRFDQFIVNANYVIPFVTAWNGSNMFTFTAGDRSVYAGNADLYGRVVWLQNTTNISSNIITSSNAANYKLVTELKANHYCYEWSNPTKISCGQYQYGTTSWSGSDMTAHKAWKVSGGSFYYYKDFTGGDTIDLSSNKIHPFFICEVDEKLYCLALTPAINHYKSNYNYTTTQQNPPQTGYSYTSWDNSDSFDVGVAAQQSWDSSFANTGWNFPYTYPVNSAGQYGYATILQGYEEDNITAFGVVGGTIQSRFNGWEFDFYFKERDDVYKLLSGCGVYFKTDKIYKPIINNGYVIGYTDDLSTQSDIDNWQGTTNHNIPPAPPSPTPPSGDDEDNDDPIPVTGAPYSSGLARYYATTAGSLILAHISQAMGAWNLKDSGKDLYKNIISCKLIKSPAPIPVSGSEPFTVYGVTLQYEGSDITLPVINDNPTASFGSYNIPRKFNDFRDYAPYTKVEIYLPYCGWTVLPSHVVGRSVSVTYYTDIIAATCKAVVYCGANVVAEAAGVIGLDIPMVTENAGAKAEAVTMGLLAYGKAGLQTALGVGAAVASKGKVGVKSAVGGLENLVSAYSQTAMAFNQNYTEINGKNGDGCCIAGISAIVIKITRPKYGANTTAPFVPSNYGHSAGFVSMKSATVGSFTGLLVADNVDTSGISGATDREKQLIKLYLESGIYVNHPN